MLYKNIFFTFIIVTLFFGAVELVLASLGIRPALLTEDPLVGFAENIPQFVEDTREDGSAILRTAHNKQGLFNYQEFSAHKDDNSYRIFCMGGSTTYGRPYFDEVSFCGWLRAYLNAADPARNWEVINAGGISFASYRVAKLMNELKEYQPDLFIVYTGQNEFLERRSYGALMELPSWVINLDAALSGTRTYTAMKHMLDTIRSASPREAHEGNLLGSEVDEILSHTIGPESYRRDDTLKRQVITHYRLNLIRMARIARSVDSDILFIQPAINVKDMSPFKSEHTEGLDEQALSEWQALYQRATGLQMTGHFSAALPFFQQALDIDDRYAELHYRQGQVLFELGQHDKAERAFRRAVEEDVAPLRILGSMQRIVEEIAASEDVPLIDFPSILRAAYSSQYGHTVFGKEFFPDHVHTNLEGYRLLGLAVFDLLVEKGITKPDASWDDERIQAVGQEVVAGLDPGIEGLAMLNLGKVLDWAGKFDEAYHSFKRAEDILGPNPVIYERIAVTSHILGKNDQAIGYLQKALEIAPDMQGIHSRLAMILGRQGKTDEAIRHCRAELELDPGNYAVNGGLATLLERKGDDAAALRYYETALKLKPDYEFARVKLVYLLIRQNRHSEALPHAEEVLRLNPKQYRAHNALGLIRKNQGKTDEAVRHFSEALRLQPNNRNANINLQQLQSEQDTAGVAGDLSS